MDEKKYYLDLLKSDPEKFISEVQKGTKDPDLVEKYTQEYKEFKRDLRDGQVDSIQKDKNLDSGSVVKMVKIYINHAQNIVETLSTFMVGKPLTLKPSEDNRLHKLLKQQWRVNRLDSKLLKATQIKMSETQVALNFYISEASETSTLNKILTTLKLKKQPRQIKVNILDNANGVMTPVWNTRGDDMLMFMWSYELKTNGKTVKHVEVWDEANMYSIDDSTGSMTIMGSPKHGFDKIPIVYDSQDEPQWYSVKSPIDRHEVALSKLGDANDYSGHPIMVSEGDVTAMPAKNSSGKHINIPIKVDGEGNAIKGKVSFLEAKNAPESNKLEIEKLEDIIAYGSGVPNLSLEKLKELGNVAEKTVKLMFLATEIKTELKRAELRTMVERCINVMMSGVVTSTNTTLKSESETLYYDIQFNSILPSDIAEKVGMVNTAITGGFMSTETGVEIIDMTDDPEEELARIRTRAEPKTGDVIETPE